MILHLLFLAGGLALLIKGADWLVEGATSLARKHRISELAIGLTIVAFGTSAPELVVNTYASWNNSPDIVFGNVIGSNNFNLFFILGLTGLFLPLSVQSSTVWKEIPTSFFAILLLILLGNEFFISGNSNFLSRIDGVVLLLMFAGFLYYVYKQLGKDKAPLATDKIIPGNFRIWLYIILGLTGLVIGGRLVVDHAIQLANAFGVSEKIIGLTIIAAGTSLPELATSLVAARRKSNDIAVGNIIGSNIFNLFLILGVSALVRPLPFNPSFNTDLLFLAGGTLFLFVAMFSGGRKKLDRWEGAVLLGAFLAYSVILVVKEV